MEQGTWLHPSLKATTAPRPLPGAEHRRKRAGCTARRGPSSPGVTRLSLAPRPALDTVSPPLPDPSPRTPSLARAAPGRSRLPDEPPPPAWKWLRTCRTPSTPSLCLLPLWRCRPRLHPLRAGSGRAERPFAMPRPPQTVRCYLPICCPGSPERGKGRGTSHRDMRTPRAEHPLRAPPAIRTFSHGRTAVRSASLIRSTTSRPAE